MKLAHIEAGLRSFDLDMPEEINRMVTDRLSDLLFTPDELADANLRNEGADEARIARVGNIMIDTLETHREEAARIELEAILRNHAHEAAVTSEATSLDPANFAVMTLHRPSNVDDQAILSQIMDFIIERLAPQIPLVWPIHPRTLKNLATFGLWNRVRETPGIVILNPVGYVEMLKLNMDARLMLTDSGGLQEECCIFGTPCLTLRWNTERPKTLVEHSGVSLLVGNDIERIAKAFTDAMDQPKQPHRPELWDGHVAERIVKKIVQQPG